MSSYVSVATKACIICGTEYESGEILLDKKMKDKLERTTCTGLGAPCPTCDKKYKDKFVLIGVSDDDANVEGERLDAAEVNRTGMVVGIPNELAKEMFGDVHSPIGFMGEGELKKLTDYLVGNGAKENTDEN